MLSNVSEKKLHIVRWIIFLAWALLIVSLFYDPISAGLTHPEHHWSPLADHTIAIAQDSSQCIVTQIHCVDIQPYPIGTRVFWGMVVPSAIFIVLVFGHEFWRRICPLYFFSQIPRALGMKPLLNIKRNQWLQKNHFYVQFVLFFLGITGRILIFNSVRPAVAILFIITLLASAIVVALYGGRSWCHYVCPFGMVQTVFTGPSGLFDSKAHTAAPRTLTQSTCRTVDAQGQEKNACVACKSACMDIDSEQSYWKSLYKPGRRLVQYGYLGLVVGYFFYYRLYSGNFDYYFSGVWSHESQALDTLDAPGFYIFDHLVINIPKFIAAPLSLAAFAAASFCLCTRLELYYRGYLKQRSLNRKGPTRYESAEAIAEESLHKIFSLCTFLAFNIFFIYGGRPEVMHLSLAVQFSFQALIAIVSSLWLQRTWGRSRAQYQRESLAHNRRRQLRKLALDVDDLLLSNPKVNRTIEHLSAEELNILTHTLPHVTPQAEQKSSNRKSESLPKKPTRIPHKSESLPKKPIRTPIKRPIKPNRSTVFLYSKKSS